MDQTSKIINNVVANSQMDLDSRIALLKKLSRDVNKNSYKLPKKSCKYCYGRGYIGWLNGIESMKVPCRCVIIRVRGKR